MIRTLLKLAIVALLANAAWHVVGAYLPNYRFTDGVQFAAEHRGKATDEALKEKVLAIAAQFDVPLTADDVSVTHDGALTTIDASYIRPIEFAPGLKPYLLPFPVHIQTRPPRNELDPQ